MKNIKLRTLRKMLHPGCSSESNWSFKIYAQVLPWVSGVEGTGWSVAWHPVEGRDGQAEKVLQKHGLFFTDIKGLAFPVYYKTCNFPQAGVSNHIAYKTLASSKRKRLERSRPKLSKPSVIVI